MIDKNLLKKKDKILQLCKTIKSNGSAGRASFERDWVRNIRYGVGDQWIWYNGASLRWERIDFTKKDDWQPRPITNKFGSAGGTITSVLTQREPKILVFPATDSDSDIATAKIGEDLVEVLSIEADLKTTRKMGGAWLVYTGNAFFHQYYEVNTDYGTFTVGFEKCQDCGTIASPQETVGGGCPQCKSNSLVKAIDAQGQEIGESFTRGKIKSDAVSPLEMYLNQKIENFKDIREMVRAKRYPIKDLEAYYPELKDKIKETPSDGLGDMGAVYLESLAYVTQGGGFQSGIGAGEKVPTATCDYLYSLPVDDFPKGLCATIVGDEFAELTDLPEYGPEKKRFLPFVFCGMKKVAGRLWHMTYLDDVAPKQIQRNKLEAFVDLGIFRMAAPHWLSRQNSFVVKPTGEPGQHLEFIDTGLPNQKPPQKIEGTNMPESVFKRIEMIDREIEELAKTVDVLKGIQPSAQTPFASLSLLTEQAYGGHKEMRDNWEDANTEVFKQLIEIARANFTEPRKRTLRNENGDWETRQFTKADLQGGVTVQTESGSTIPHSQAAERQGIKESIGLGLIDPSSPKVHRKILERMGQSEFGSGIDEDVEDASREWNIFVESVKANPENQEAWVTRLRDGIDNHSIHYLDASSRAKTEEFFEFPPLAQSMWIEHAAAHKNFMEAEKMRQAQLSQPPQPISRLAVAGGGKGGPKTALAEAQSLGRERIAGNGAQPA